VNLLLLGKGKTGALVADVARERGHQVTIFTSAENPDATALTGERLRDVDCVIDFTNPHAVLDNVRACIRLCQPLVVGTTGWYEHVDAVRAEVESSGTALLYGSNFSIGVNMFFEIAGFAAGLARGYSARILETHHIHKKDAPSGTAVSIQKVVKESAGIDAAIESIREGDVVGRHQLTLQSAADSIVLLHDAKSRRGFAEGAVRAAEWLPGKSGFFEFRNIYRQL
jgi:4-hydroxy-tetrahydrodipicolinate reductase